MRNIIKCLLILFCISVSLSFQTYAQATVNIKNADIEKPLTTVKGQTLKILCDSVILISPLRFHMYEKARNSIISTDFEKSLHLFDVYNEQMQTYKQWNDSLQMKYNELNALFVNNLDNTKTGLIQINTNLTVAKDSLNSANNHLDQALLHLKAANREKWYFGTVGFLLGTLLTVLVVSK
ncbi:MAG: hypothetical protein NTZ33_03060 [Bacteroidetes bacterium]|nr:hypothetical protein [Bacteroidota bacterium]